MGDDGDTQGPITVGGGDRRTQTELGQPGPQSLNSPARSGSQVRFPSKPGCSSPEYKNPGPLWLSLSLSLSFSGP